MLKPARGFALMTILVALVLVAAMAVLLATQVGGEADRARRGLDALQAQYVAQAALEHARWSADRGTCAAYGLPTTSFGAHQYAATFSPTSGSPTNVTASATLGSGASRDITRQQTRAHQAATTVTLQLGTDPGGDTILDAFYPRNYGGYHLLFLSADPSWVTRPLLRFDLATKIPARARVLEARLELRVTGLRTPGTASARRVSRSWVEGTRTGGGTPDGATWTTYDATQPWAAAGGDFDAESISRATITAVGAWASFDLTRLVQAWVDGAPNYGVAIVGEGALDDVELASGNAANAADRPRLTIRYACECGVACALTQGTRKVLMVVSNGGNPSAAEAVKKSLFESWGYVVETIDQNASQSGYDAELGDNDVVFVPASADPVRVATKLTGTTKGVVSENGALNDELKLAASAAYATGDTLTIGNNTHYITQPFGLGPLRIYDARMELALAGGSAAPQLEALGTTGATPSLAVLEAGASAYGGGVAAGRRVTLPLGRTLDWRFVNNNARVIVQRALEWGAGAGSACASSSPLLYVVGNPTTPTVQETARQTVLESWCYTVTRIDDGATQAQFDAAVATTSVVYVSAEAVTSQVGTKLKAKTVGIVNEDPGLHGSFGFSTSRASTSANAPLNPDGGHYITAPFGGSAITLFTANQPSGAAVGTLPAGLGIIGRWASGTYGTLGGLLILEQGAAIAGGGTAAGRRVQLPWDGVEGGAVADIGGLTADGRTLLRRALEWAAGRDAATGPIAHWRLDETSGLTAVDSAGGHDGTLAGGPTWTAGALGGALAFDGLDDQISVPHAATLSLTQAFTLMAFVRATDLAGFHVILNKGDTAPDYNYSLFTRDDELNLGFSVSGAYIDFVTTNVNLQTNRWYHVAATFDNATDQVRLYVDGVRVHTSDAATVQPQVNGGALYVGRSQWSGEHWQGTLDDVRVYNRVLSPSEVAGVAVSGLSAYYLDTFPDFVCDGPDEYRGSRGTRDWSDQAWTEIGDDGRACGADFRAVDDPDVADPTGNRLRLTNKSRAIRRTVDLSGFAKAELGFRYRRRSMNAGTFAVRASGDGGATWIPLATISTGNDSQYLSASYDLSAVVGASAVIEFSVDSNFSGEAYVDDVRIDLSGAAESSPGRNEPPSCSATFADDFETNSYSGSSGTGSWATAWSELNESDGSGGGDIRIVTSSVSGLRLQTKNSKTGIMRGVNLAAYAKANLRLTYERSGLDDADDYLALEVSGDGGASWTELDRFAGPANISSPQLSVRDITSYIGSDTRIRLSTSASLGKNDIVYVDNVVIEASNCP